MKQPPNDPAKRALAGHGYRIAGVAVSAVFAAASEAAFLVLVTNTAFALTDDDADVALVAGFSGSVTAALLLASAAVVLRLMFGLVNARLAARVNVLVGAQMRDDLANAYLGSQWAVQQGDSQGHLQELLTTFANKAAELVIGRTGMITAAFSLAALLVASIVVDPIASLVVIGAVGALGLVLRPVRQSVGRRSERSSVIGQEYAGAVAETSSIQLETQVFGVQSPVLNSLQTLVQRGALAAERHLFARNAVPVVYLGLAYLSLTGALALTAATNAADVAAIGTVILLMLRSLTYGQMLQVSSATISTATPFARTFYSEVDRYRQAVRGDGQNSVRSVTPLTLENVSFAYEPDTPVLKSLDLTLREAEVVGIVGPSGSGKSTLVQLLLGLRDPTMGRVLADARDVRELSRAEWVRMVTFVPQQAHLIAGTVSDNIRFLRENVTPEMIERASRLANLHEDVAAFADGYERQVGDQGSRLSGGQQQRLIIARALVENPQLLILDEPTSALDVRSEHLVRETLNTLRTKMTIVIVAHRLSTLEICDRIMVIQNGELKGFDTPRNLEKANDFYREALILSGLR